MCCSCRLFWFISVTRFEISALEEGIPPYSWASFIDWAEVPLAFVGDHYIAKMSVDGGLCVSYIYLLTPWCRVLLEKLTGLQLVKKFPAFHGTRRSITALTSVRHLSLSWANQVQSAYPHPTSWRSILILSTHLRLGLPTGLLPSGFPTKTLYTLLVSYIYGIKMLIED